MTATPTAAHHTPAPAPWRQVARLQVRPWATHLGWFWLTMAVITSGVTVATWIVSGHVTESVWNWLLVGPRYYLLVVAILMTLQLGTYVSHGATRRDTVLGIQAFLVVASVVFALLAALFFAVETVVFDQLGWSNTIGTGSNGAISADVPGTTVSSATDWGGIVLATLPIHLGWLVGAQLVTLAYQRWGGIRGTLALPLTLAPGIGVQMLFDAENRGEVGSALLLETPVPIVLAVALSVVVVTGLACHWLARDLAIRTG